AMPASISARISAQRSMVTGVLGIGSIGILSAARKWSRNPALVGHSRGMKQEARAVDGAEIAEEEAEPAPSAPVLAEMLAETPAEAAAPALRTAKILAVSGLSATIAWRGQ